MVKNDWIKAIFPQPSFPPALHLWVNQSVATVAALFHPFSLEKMIRISILGFTLALLALVGCSTADQVAPAAEAEVVTGDWVAMVYAETVRGIEVVHTHPIPNTAAFWLQLEADGTYIPNTNAIEEDLGSAKNWEHKLKEEEVASMGMYFVDLADAEDEIAYKTSNQVYWEAIETAAEHACNDARPSGTIGTYGNLLIYEVVFSCTQTTSPIPGWCLFHLYGYGKWFSASCHLFGFNG